MEGQIVLRKMVAIAGSRMQIIAAGKVTKDNWKPIQELTGVSELHGKRIVF
jgi:copper homeostasis protein